MRVLDQINLNQLKVFEYVYRAGNMTEAARQLSLTQSAISQQIKSLEETLKVRLFDRGPSGLTPTTAATALFLRCEEGFSLVEQSLRAVTGAQANLTGTVSIGTPPEFGEAVLLPLLSNFMNQHKQLHLQIKIAQSSELSAAVAEGDLSFAFVDSFIQDKRLKHRRVFDEGVVLCASPSYLKAFGTPMNRKEYYEQLEYVDYTPGEPILRMWFEHHLGKKNLRLTVRVHAQTCKSVSQLIREGVGAGVLPSEQIEALEQGGHKLYRFEGSRRPLVNAINVASLANENWDLPSRSLFDWLLSRLALTNPFPKVA